MSFLIPTNLAYSIVRECCEQLSPMGPALRELQQFLDQVENQLDGVVVPSESGISLPGGPITLPGIKPAPGIGTRPTTAPYPIKPISTKRIFTVPREMVQEVSRFIKTMKGTLKALSVADPCFLLLGCVAEGLRKRALPQSKGPRFRVVDRTFLQHWQAEGLLPKHLPRKFQHIRRSP